MAASAKRGQTAGKHLMGCSSFPEGRGSGARLFLCLRQSLLLLADNLELGEVVLPRHTRPGTWFCSPLLTAPRTGVTDDAFHPCRDGKTNGAVCSRAELADHSPGGGRPGPARRDRRLEGRIAR